MDCFKDMCTFLQGNNKFDLAAIKRKYGKSKYHQVSKIKLLMNEWINQINLLFLDLRDIINWFYKLYILNFLKDY